MQLTKMLSDASGIGAQDNLAGARDTRDPWLEPDPYFQRSPGPFSAPDGSLYSQDRPKENTPGGSREPRTQKEWTQWDRNLSPINVKREYQADEEFIDSFRQQVASREIGPSKASYLGAASNLLYRADDKALAKLKSMTEALEHNKQKNGTLSEKERRDVQNQLKLLQTEEKHQAQFGMSTTTVLKMAPLFVPGTTGWVLTAGVNALDAASPSSSFGRQAIDLTLGTTKGLALRGALTMAPEPTSSLALQGVGLGITSRVLEAGLSSRSYIDPQTNQFELSRGLSAVVDTTFNPYALVGDALTMGIASVGIKNINGLTGGIISNSSVARTLTMGGVFGMANGFSSEAIRQYQADDYSYVKLFQSGMKGFGLGLIAAAPGALAVHVQPPVPYPPHTWGRQPADGGTGSTGKYSPGWSQVAVPRPAVKLPGAKVLELPHKSY